MMMEITVLTQNPSLISAIGAFIITFGVIIFAFWLRRRL